jgi:hypothetical protein
MKAKSARRRMKEYRIRLREEGLRPLQLWVLDDRGEDFKEELKRQISNLEESTETEALDFIEHVAEGPAE